MEKEQLLMGIGRCLRQHLVSAFLPMHSLKMYLDDTGVFSNSLEGHIGHLWLVLHLHDHEHHTEHAKCEPNQPESALVLSHTVDYSEGGKVDPKKTGLVKVWALPQDVSTGLFSRAA